MRRRLHRRRLLLLLLLLLGGHGGGGERLPASAAATGGRAPEPSVSRRIACRSAEYVVKDAQPLRDHRSSWSRRR